MGALVDDSQLRTVMGYIDAGQTEGATLLTGGTQARAETGGYYVEPTVFTGVRNDMKIAREEIFGPVMAVIPFEDEADALRIANDTRYGLAAAVWSRDTFRCLRVVQQNFSAELRAWLLQPGEFRDAIVQWQKSLHRRGWIAPNWPERCGGTGWSATRKYIYELERSRLGIPDVTPFGLKMVGPVIYTFGSEEQQRRCLPPILASDHWWCQGRIGGVHWGWRAPAAIPA